MISTVSNTGSFNFNPKSESIASEALSLAKNDLKDLSKNSFAKVFNRVDNFFDFGTTKNFDFSSFNKEEMNSFLKVMSTLMSKGIVGYEYYEVNGKTEKHFMTTSLGNRRLYNAEWKKREDSRGGWLV